MKAPAPSAEGDFVCHYDYSLWDKSSIFLAYSNVHNQCLLLQVFHPLAHPLLLHWKRFQQLNIVSANRGQLIWSVKPLWNQKLASGLPSNSLSENPALWMLHVLHISGLGDFWFEGDVFWVSLPPELLIMPPPGSNDASMLLLPRPATVFYSKQEHEVMS